MALEDEQSRPRGVETLDAGHDVDHGFGIEARNRRAPDVFNSPAHEKEADRTEKNLAFSLEADRPMRIVRNKMHWRVVGHASTDLRGPPRR